MVSCRLMAIVLSNCAPTRTKLGWPPAILSWVRAWAVSHLPTLEPESKIRKNGLDGSGKQAKPF